MNASKPSSTTWRGLAAVTVIVWLVAQVFCGVHCTTGKLSLATSVSASKGCCKKSADAEHASGGQSTCLSAKMIVPAPQAGADLIAPNQVEIATTLLLAELLSSIALETPTLDRPVPRPERVIAHEVSLGSAARAHAPPVLA